jgi:hypothetical protein
MRRTHKYNARRTLYNGVWYDSKLEAKLAADIELLIISGMAKGVERQKAFTLHGLNRGSICTHYVDFLIEFKDGHYEVWEAKGYPTPEWKLKKKLFEDNYPDIKYVVHSKKRPSS